MDVTENLENVREATFVSVNQATMQKTALRSARVESMVFAATEKAGTGSAHASPATLEMIVRYILL